MKKVFLLLPLFAICLGGHVISPVKKELTKEDVIKLYNDYYLASEIDSIPWKGSIENCDPGTIPTDLSLKAEKRVNFFRLVNYLPTIAFKKEYNELAQSAAFICLVNKELSHYPPKTWKCYTEDAAKGAVSSNLGFSDFKFYKSTAFVTGLIQEFGDANSYCGHRRWMLYSKAKEMGYGATYKSEALYVMGYDNSLKLENEFIAYPWNGYVPVNLIYPKWSFSIPEHHIVNFDKCKVTVKDDTGKNYNFTLYEQHKNYIDHSIVWEMTDLFTKEERDYTKNNLKQKGFV
ncbi:MAG TPA: CAP domain-containing protein, partial [Nitrosopumilaceae archaeon]|nr:CAP domain-containing protein [Nitrosopumilaceae archaeon]